MTLLRISATTALALMIAAPVAADVTAAQVWDDWQSYMQGFGYQVQGNAVQAGNVLTVSGVTMTAKVPQDGGTISFAIDNVTFTEQGDGTVAVGLPASMPIAAAVKGEDGKPIELAIDYTQTGLVMTVSGDPDAMAYAYAADELALIARKIVVDGTPLDLRAARMAMTGVTGDTRTTSGATTRSAAQTLGAATVTWDLDMTNPTDQTPVRIAGQMNGPAFAGTTLLPAGIDWADMSALMAAGFRVDGKITHQGGSSDMRFVDDGTESGLKTSSTGGDLTVRMDKAAIAYGGTTTGARYEMTGGPVQLPITLDIATAGFNLLIPVEQSDEPRDFALGLTLADVVMSDMIWAMLDPTGQLPRDPATLALDLTGKARLTADLTDPALAQSGAMPGEIHALTLNGMTLRLAGAALSGTGAFTFDNSDTTTMPGMPRPDGALDMKLVGGNALLDKLIAMGLLPQEQAMGMRMMMGVFGKMDGPDSLTSKIEFTREGQILANGQRIR